MAVNYIQEYYNRICSGKIVAGKWIKKVYAMVLEGIEKGLWFYDESKADKAVKFIENFVHHSKGRHDLLHLELWQKAIVSCLFGIVDNLNNRQFHETLIVVARKNGKTLFAAAIAEYMAYADREYGAEIYCLAPKLAQADLVYNAFFQSVKLDEELSSEEMTKKRKNDIYVIPMNTTISKVAFNCKKADGFNPHLTVCDELAAWPGQAGLKQYEVMKSALGSRKQPLILSITTAGYINDGIYDELFKRSTRFLKGKLEVGEMRLLPFLYVIDDIQKWDDINELKKSNPNLGISVSESYYLEEIVVAKNSTSKKAEFMCKYCNILQNSSIAWLAYEDVALAGGESLKLEDFRKCYAIAGVDLSRTTDLTAATVVICKSGHFYIFTQFFMPEDSFKKACENEPETKYEVHRAKGRIVISGQHFVDYHDVFNWFVMLRKEYKIMPLMIGYDRYSAQYLIQDLDASGFKVDDVFQGTNLSPIMDEFEGLLKEGKIHFGDNELLKKQFLDVAVKINDSDERKKPVKIESRLHIDGPVSVFDAFTVRSKHYKTLGKMLENRKAG